MREFRQLFCKFKNNQEKITQLLQILMEKLIIYKWKHFLTQHSFLRYRKWLQENGTLSSQVTGPESHKGLKWFSANVVLLNARWTTGISEFICFVFESLHCALIQNFMTAVIRRLLVTTGRKFHINIICHFQKGGWNFPVIFTKYFYQNKRR